MISRRRKALVAILAAALAGLVTPASAQPFRQLPGEIFGTRVTIGCVIRSGNLIFVLNTTGQPIAAGTEVRADVVLMPGEQHRLYIFSSPLVPAGAYFVEEGEPASSCTAWMIRPLVITRG